MTTHSSTLAWKIPWTEKPGRLQSMGLQRAGHHLVTKAPKVMLTRVLARHEEAPPDGLNQDPGTSLAVRWLRLCFHLGEHGFIPGRGRSLMPCTALKKKINKMVSSFFFFLKKGAKVICDESYLKNFFAQTKEWLKGNISTYKHVRLGESLPFFLFSN